MKEPNDEDNLPFERRPNADPFGGAGWSDVNTEDDPGSLGPNEFQRAQNVRVRGKNIISRPGPSLRIDLNLYSSRTNGVGHVLWANDAPGNDSPTRLWLASFGCLGGGSTGYAVLNVDPSRTNQLQVYAEGFAVANRFAPLAPYGDLLYMGDSNLLKEVIQIQVPYNLQVVDLLGLNAAPVIERKNFDGYTIRCMRQHEGMLYIGLENNAAAANSKIVAYDGSQYRDDITGIRPPIAFGQWQNKLVCGFDATAGHIRVRTSGSAVPGTWTTYALGGYQTSVSQNAMQEVRNKLYIASGATQVYQFDGTALSVANTVATADATGDGVTSLCLHDNLLHYGWNTTVTLVSHIGRHDPDSTAANEWVDDYINITAQQATFLRLGCMASYRRQIYCGGSGGFTGSLVWLVRTAVNDVQGTVQVLSSTSVGTPIRFRQLLLFP